MSSRGSYSQKKKREAVRRLSQQHSRQAARAASSSLFSNEPLRRRKSLEKRRSHDEAGPGTRQGRRDEGKRFISPMNNPDLASSTSAPNTAGRGLFGKPSNVAPNSSELASELFSQSKTESPSGSALFPQASTAGTSLFSQASSSGTSLFSQKSSFGGTSAGLFGKPSVSSSSSVFGSQSSTFGSFGTKSSLFGQGIDSDSSLEDAGTKQPSFQVTFDSGGDDEAGIGRTVETADAPRSDRRVLTRDSATRETERSSGSFGQSSPLRDEETSRRRTSLKRELSPSKPSSASQRLLTSHDDVFESDISDLESFGSAPSKPKVEKESMQGRAAVKRSGLFERAIDDASGRREAVFKKQRSEERSPKESVRGQKQSSVFVSSSEVKHLTTIVVKDVPEELNNRIFLNKFFSKFGRVKKITVSPRKAMATVYFEDHKSAAQAKRDVKTLKLGTRPVTIFWTQKEKSKEKRKSDENVPPPNIEAETEVPVDPPQKREKPPAPPPASSVSRSTKGYHTASERYDALEERDKQIRKGMTKQSDLATAKKMTGTCPDMCPEKERYMREVQRRLSPYETDTGKVEKGENPHVCHTKAVKEYSRSSADQEEPLPSELRPPAVLDLTMNYLMGEIMNREPTGLGGDGRSWADWFDFLWNRTRSIRKEITQQQLCGITAVSLMEKCARFHIYCSYRLCEEGHMAFDPKINNENLTKCLQSLKQFYHDLADEGVFCPNEAEFRAYEVLLNLTGGDILREVQQYRPEVRNSEAVVFSLKVSAAFSSNNYCRFFKLIRAASFLNACILHRYFVQLRCLALETMNKAFTTPKGVSMFPTAELVHLLAFEDDDQASMFCECHGLSTVDGCIQLSRGGFYYPEETLTSQRAPSVIEAKNDRSIGEVVNNGPLPVAPPHTPFSSFDENGRLLERVVEAKPVKEMQQAERKVEMKAPQESIPEITQQPVQVQQDISTAKVEESKPTISSEVIKDITKELFLEVIDEMVRDLSTRFMDTLAIIQASPQVLADIMQEELGVMSRHVAMETLEEEKYAEAKRKAAAEEASRKEKEMNALRQEASREISEEIVEEVVERTLQEIIVNEISAYQSELRKEAMDRCSSAVSEELLQDLVRSEVTDISSEVIAVATAERDRRLEEIAEAYRLRQLAYLYQKWCRVHTKRVKIRRALETFPAGPPNQNTAEQLEVLWPKRREQSGGVPSQVDTDMVLKSRLPLPMSLDTPYGVVSERESLAKHIMHHHYLTLVRQQRAWEPLDLPTIHSDNTHSSQHASSPTRQHVAACRYWKLVASLPQGSYDDRSPCNWLKAKLRRGKISEQLRRSRLRDNESVETLSLYTQRVGSSPLGVCTKAVMGPPGGKDVRYQLMGNSGIILMVEGETQACFRDAGQRLKAILSQTPSRPSLPVLVCVVSDEDLTSFQSDLSQSMQLHHLTQEGVISCWKLIRIPRDVVRAEASEQLEEGLAWLASHHPDPPSVVSEMVKEYLDNGLTQFFSTSVHQLSKQRRETGQFPLSPQSIVSLYNSVMDHLASVASSFSLSDISWPPAEFTSQQHPDLPSADWNTPASLTALYTTINTLQLPDMPYVEDSDWLSVCDACVSYVRRLPGRDRDKAPLLSRVRWLLDKSKRAFEDTCFMTFDTEGCKPSSQHAPWADILEECVTYMMSTLASGQEGESPSLGSQQVYFHQSEFNKFEFPVEWKQEMNETLEESVAEHESMQHSIVEAVSMRQSALAEEELREREERRRRRAEERLPDNTSFLLPEDVTMTISHTQSGLLRRMLDKEREESLRFEAMLTSFLEEEPMQGLQQRLHVQADKPESEFRLQLPPLPKASLTKSLEDPHPKTDAPIITLEDTDDTLSDQIQSLKERLASEKQAALMAEMRLNALLGL